MSSGRKLAIVGIRGLPPQYGGFETLAHFLVKNLADKMDITVYCSGPNYPERNPTYLSAKLKYLPLRANGAQSVLFDMLSLLDGCIHADAVLVLGVSGGIFFPLAHLFGKRVILNIGGLDWKRAKWGRWASRFLKLSEAVAVKWADVLVADNAGIGSYLESEYGRQSVLIEYGGDHNSVPPITEERRQRYPFLDAPYAIAVARIQADNNIEMILEAFSQSPSHVLVMVGNWANSVFGRELKARYSNRANIHLLEAIYDLEELNTLRGHCAVYIHGHSAGGTAPSLVEAMYLSLPVAAFDVNYNLATTESAAHYFRDAAELAELMDCVSPAEWRTMRAVMKDIADRRYLWSIIADKYAALVNA
jgi:glycosyltransferase involved in cell wall biosynthesis